MSCFSSSQYNFTYTQTKKDKAFIKLRISGKFYLNYTQFYFCVVVNTFPFLIHTLLFYFFSGEKKE